MSLSSIIGPDMVLDISLLRNADPLALTKFLSDHGNELTQRLNETAKSHLLKGEIPGHEPAFSKTPEFQGPKGIGWYRSLQSRFCRNCAKGSTLPLIFPIAVYLHECYGLSPSKLILGTEPKTELPMWLRNWLAQVDLLSANDTDGLYEILEKGKSVRWDVPYTFKSRILELAAEKGIRPDDFCYYPGILTADLPTIGDFVSTPFHEEGDAYLVLKPFLGNHKMLRLLIMLSVLYQVSPDYLLLQDYSEFATTPQGRYYAPATRRLISAMLTVDAATRMKAIGFVFAVTAANASTGGSIPCVLPDARAIATAGEDTPLNVMETISAAGRSSTKKKIEEEIVNSLKVKLLDILEHSNGPLSSTHLYSVVEGHSRLARSALSALEKEGKIVKIPKERSVAFWEANKKKK